MRIAGIPEAAAPKLQQSARCTMADHASVLSRCLPDLIWCLVNLLPDEAGSCIQQRWDNS